MSKLFVILTFTVLALIWTFVQTASPKEACVLDDEIDICPGNMTCQLDGSGHPYCHIPGNPVPNSHCLTEGEYEPYLLKIRDFEGHEECEPFTKPCSNKYICCRTHHGHRCFPEESATLLQTNYRSRGDP